MNAIYFIAGFLFVYMFSNKKTIPKTVDPLTEPIVIPPNEIPVIESVVNLFEGISFDVNVPRNLLFAIVHRESGSLIFRGVPNENVIGDNGNSIGFFQVSQPALTEVNIRENESFSFEDLYDFFININVGALYLSYCYQKAIDENVDIVYTTAKCYNGGLDETYLSKNSMADEYARGVKELYNYYETFNG